MKWAQVPSKKGLHAWTPSRERPRAGTRCRRLPQPVGLESVANGWRGWGGSAASSPVGLPLPATTWCRLPAGSWPRQGPPGSGGRRGGREEGRGRQEALWSFFPKPAVVNTHYQSPTHSRLIGQDTEASGYRIDPPKIPRWRTGPLLESAQGCQAQLFSAMSFCHRNLGLWTLARKLSADLRAHKLT